MLTQGKYRGIWLLICLLLFVSRLIYLDQDTPSYMIGGVSQEDEGCITVWGRSTGTTNRKEER